MTSAFLTDQPFVYILVSLAARMHGMCSHAKKKCHIARKGFVSLACVCLVASMKCFLEKGPYGDDPNLDRLVCGLRREHLPCRTFRITHSVKLCL